MCEVLSHVSPPQTCFIGVKVTQVCSSQSECRTPSVFLSGSEMFRVVGSFSSEGNDPVCLCDLVSTAPAVSSRGQQTCRLLNSKQEESS